MDNISKAGYTVGFIFEVLFCKKKNCHKKMGRLLLPALYYLHHYC